MPTYWRLFFVILDMNHTTLSEIEIGVCRKYGDAARSSYYHQSEDENLNLPVFAREREGIKWKPEGFFLKQKGYNFIRHFCLLCEWPLTVTKWILLLQTINHFIAWTYCIKSWNGWLLSADIMNNEVCFLCISPLFC